MEKDQMETTGTLIISILSIKDISRMSEFQKRIVSTLVNSDKVWMVSSNLLEAYGLPNEREEVRRLLAE